MTTPSAIPAIKITPVTRESGPVTLAALTATLDPLAPGCRMTVTRYNPGDPAHVSVRRVRSSGPVLFGMEESTEIHWLEKTDGRVNSEWIHWVVPGSGGGSHRLVMREQRQPDGTGYVEMLDVSCPSVVTPGDSWTRMDRYIQGSEVRIQPVMESVSGPYCVRIEKTDVECICVRARVESISDRYSETYFRIDSGEAVLCRILDASETVVLMDTVQPDNRVETPAASPPE